MPGGSAAVDAAPRTWSDLVSFCLIALFFVLSILPTLTV